MDSSDLFQGVACCCVDSSTTLDETLYKLLNLPSQSVHHNVQCRELILSNRYYTATIHFLDSDKLIPDDDGERIYDKCHAVIICGDGQKITIEQLDERREKFAHIGGEPRILLCHGIDEECNAYKTIQDWCISHGYDFLISTDEGVKVSLIDSLSAYKWPYRLAADTLSNGKRENGKTAGGLTKESDLNLGSSGERQLDEQLMKKLVDFDSLLNKLSTYRDNPELRGNSEDKNIEEIAKILSGLLGDDVDDDFLTENYETPTQSSNTPGNDI